MEEYTYFLVFNKTTKVGKKLQNSYFCSISFCGKRILRINESNANLFVREQNAQKKCNNKNVARFRGNRLCFHGEQLSIFRGVRLTDEHLIKPFNCGNEQKDLDLADFTFLASLCWITE